MNKKAKLINVDDDLNNSVIKAVELYNNDEVFIYPTDTVYGFGCNPFNTKATDKINKIKKRKDSKQYILLIDSLDTLFNYIIKLKKSNKELLEIIWPNPVSVILELNEEKKKALRSETVAFRIPDHRFCMNLLRKIKSPLVSTSVNINGEPPLKNYSAIYDKFSTDISIIFFTNNEESKEPSTLVDLCGEKPVILRQGNIKFTELIQKFM